MEKKKKKEEAEEEAARRGAKVEEGAKPKVLQTEAGVAAEDRERKAAPATAAMEQLGLELVCAASLPSPQKLLSHNIRFSVFQNPGLPLFGYYSGHSFTHCMQLVPWGTPLTRV